MRRFELLAILSLGLLLFAGPAARAKTWGAELNPGGNAPLGSFKAIYFNTKNPHEVIATEIVPAIAINYSWDEFHGIKSEDFGAYWVGRMDFRKEETRVIELSLSWSKARVFVDGQLVCDSDADDRKPFTFSKGRHLIEVEFANNWHTTSFLVAFKGSALPISDPEVLAELNALKLVNPEVHYVGVYESDAKDLSVRLNVERAGRPLILVLSSYDSVDWVLHEEHPGDVRAIVYGSFKPGVEIGGIDPRKVLVLARGGMIGSHDLNPRCSCAVALYHCEDSGSLLTTVTEVERLTGAPMTSFNGSYSAEQVTIPGLPVNAEAKEHVNVRLAQQQHEREKCEAKANPDFDRMFDKKAEVQAPH